MKLLLYFIVVTLTGLVFGKISASSPVWVSLILMIALTAWLALTYWPRGSRDE
jgi:hypothetical protein